MKEGKPILKRSYKQEVV